MTRLLQYQKGYVSDPVKTHTGVVFKIRYRVPGPDGKLKHRCETLRGLTGKKAARAVLDDRIKNLSSAPTQQASELTLREFIDAFWKPTLTRKRVKPSTLDGYESVLDCHLLPVLGDLRMIDITPLHVEDFVQRKIADGLAPKTVRNHLMVLRGVFSVAVEQDVIQRSPVRRSHTPESQKKEKPVWSPEQVHKIIQSAPPQYRPLFALVALTGVRVGELLALQWKHVDFQAGSLLVAQSLYRGQLVPPKRAGSVRRICLGPVLTSFLKEHYRSCSLHAPGGFRLLQNRRVAAPPGRCAQRCVVSDPRPSSSPW
jgi:integrase